MASLSWARPVEDNLDGNDMFGPRDPPVPHRLHERDFGMGGGGPCVAVAVAGLVGKAAGMRARRKFSREVLRVD